MELRTTRRSAAVLAVVAWTACAARAEDVVCPETIRVEQKLSQPAEGWKGSIDDAPNRLSHVTFYDGPPEQMASLVPDKEGRQGSKEFATWQLGGIEGWISCHYSGTNVVLSRPLPKSVTECTVTYDPRQGVPGYRDIERISCKQAARPQAGPAKATPH